MRLMRPQFGLSFAILAAALLSGCAGISGVGKSASIQGYERKVPMADVKMMRQMDRTIVQDESVITYVNSVRERLEKAHGESCKCVVVVDSFSGYEAYSVSSSTVAISAGAIAQADSTAEVAALIAHELAHVYKGDIAKGVAQDASVVLVRAAALANGGKDFTPVLGQVIEDAARGMVYHRWNAETEMEADEFGTDLLLDAGYSADGMKMAVRRLSRYSEHMLAGRQSHEAEDCIESQDDSLGLNVGGCSAALFSPEETVYADPEERVNAIMAAAWEADPAARRRNPSEKPPSFDSVSYLFAMNDLVSSDRADLAQAVEGIESRNLPTSLKGNAAVSNKLAVAHARLGNSGRSREYLTASFEADQRNAWTFTQRLKLADEREDREMVQETIGSMHDEIGYMEGLLPVEYYLAKRYELTALKAVAWGRCTSNLVDSTDTYNQCARFEEQANRSGGASW